MFKLVVLFACVAVAAAHPGYLHGGVAAYSAPAIGYSAHAIAAPAVAYAAPTVAIAAPLTATAITKHVQYASTPVVTGYTSQIVKADLGSLATPAEIVTKQEVVAPARAVQTITPQITQIQPEITVQKVAVDVPVATPVVSQVEVRAVAPTVIKTHHAIAAPALTYGAVPALTYGAVPALTYGAAPALAYGAAHSIVKTHHHAIAAPALAYGAAPALSYSIGAPGLAYAGSHLAYAAPGLVKIH